MATKSKSKSSDAKKKETAELTAITPIGIAAFAHVFEKHSFKDSDKSAYRLVLVYKKDQDFSELKKIVKAAVIKKWGEEKGLRMLKNKQLQLPFRNGEEYEQYGDPFDEDHVFISAHSNSAPGVVDQRREPIEDQFDFYSGCKARMSVYAHAYDTNGNKGVTFLLNNVQKCGDGERLSGRKNAEDDFDDVDSDDVDSDDDDADDIM